MNIQQNRIKVKEITLYDADLYYIYYAIVTLTTGEQFAVQGELDSRGKFIVKKKEQVSFLMKCI